MASSASLARRDTLLRGCRLLISLEKAEFTLAGNRLGEMYSEEYAQSFESTSSAEGNQLLFIRLDLARRAAMYGDQRSGMTDLEIESKPDKNELKHAARMVILALVLAMDPNADEYIDVSMCPFAALPWEGGDLEGLPRDLLGRSWISWGKEDKSNCDNPSAEVLDLLERAEWSARTGEVWDEEEHGASSDMKKALSMLRGQTSENGLDYWEPVFDDDGSMNLAERPTQLAAFQTLLRYLDELRRLVDCAPRCDGGIRIDNRNAFRMTLQKISLVGPVANSSQYRLKSCDTPGPGVVTSIWTPTYEGSSTSSIVNDVSLQPFGCNIRDRRHIDDKSVSLFMRRYAAFKEVVETLSDTSPPIQHREFPQPEEEVPQLSDKEIGVLAWLGHPNRRMRLFKRSEIVPDDPRVPLDTAIMRGILHSLNESGLVETEPYKPVRITPSGLQWLTDAGE